MYELLAGQALYGQQSLMEIRDAVCNQPVRPIEQVPAPLWQICQRALQRDPSQRFATAREFAEALEQVCVQTVESGKMTKDLALLVGPNQPFLTTEEFMNILDENLKARLG